MTFRTASFALTCALPLMLAGRALAYPVDGYERTHVSRLLGTLKAEETLGKLKLPKGALLGVGDMHLRLVGEGAAWDLATTPKDPVLQAALEGVFAKRDPSYGVVVIDITNPKAITWAGVREDLSQYPGSVNKILCVTALLDGLARAFPDTAKREQMLRETVVEATNWAEGDSHGIPVLDPESGLNKSRPVRGSDRFTLAEWVDHALSASANSAGTVVWREAMLLRHFGAAYPASKELTQTFLTQTSGRDLAALSLQVIEEPLRAAGLDPEQLRQGSFWTKPAKARVPGTRSFADARELSRFLLRLEQGRLVDTWSSLELKRYLYFTRKRYRYGYAPELRDAALWFKSGSLYRCQAEEGFRCAKYAGNVENRMNSIAIVETPARLAEGEKRACYLVALVSNVLRVNSAWDHARLAAAIDEVVRTRKPAAVQEAGSASDVAESGRGE